MQFDVQGGRFACTRPTCYLRLIPVMTLQQHGCVMFSAHTPQVTNVRPSRDSPHRAVILRDMPEYQFPWFQFYRASNFYCMAITAEPSLPSGPPSAANLAAFSVTVASETTRHAPGAVWQAGGDELRRCPTATAATAATAIATTKIGWTRIAKMPTATMLTRTTGMGGPHDRPCARPLTG